jgi:hypothetical protein
MAGIPREAQEKMINYNSILVERYSSSVPYFKLSAGYSKSSDAANDTNPISVIYTRDDDMDIDTGSIINIDQNKSIEYDGGDLWYHVFDSSSADLGYIISIDARGIVADKITPK